MNRQTLTLTLVAIMLVLSLAACQVEPVVVQEPSATVPTASSYIPENPPVNVLTERPTTEVVGDKDALLAAVSPDGSTIAWVHSDGGRPSKRVTELCIYIFSNAYNACTPKPEDYNSYPAQLEWSPDSATIAFSENPLDLGDESDIWVFNVADSTFVNLTDDGVYGSWRTAEPGSFVLDYLPMWNEADGLLYFWRSVPVGYMEATLQLHRISPEGGEPELVKDATEDLRGQLLLWDFEFFFMDGPWAISPDGTKAALALRSLQNMEGSPSDGLWVLDLSDPTVAPQQLATTDDFQAALPAWQETPAVPNALSWTSDSAGVVVMARSNDIQRPINVFYYAPAAGGGLTPIVDFSGVANRESFFANQEPPLLPPVFYSPWTASLSPAGDKLLMYNDLGGTSGMLSAPLPPDGQPPVVVHVSDMTTTYTASRSSSSVDGKLILYGLMFTLEE